ncbi:hypothetical protein N5853_00495 [Bartonella sp. HY329]|uniref:hypothetical protein n=1 Tax=unclassified Bartonella TaxID=2645622 RepID=UPI0021C60D39|nr:MULTISPECIES: hypothetical protein [unclassified Bartonella]UXM95175.1 hypothetical protein N5853_00495 [Bartonella sp. HY329]UXN09498.1 hypothetical protein N5852_00500 [Bartonella sp. HY328]
MLIQKVMFKYRLIILLIFPFYINSAFSQDNISLHLTHSHIRSDYLDEFISCLNKNNLNIFKSAPKNPDFLIFFDKEDKLYKYYKSSIQINFYDAYRNDNSINEDIILFYYIDINKRQFKKYLIKTKIGFCS